MIPVLDSQRSEISALDLEIQSQATLHRNLVTLYKALGGGW
jgi:outer membrane protein TolC